MHVYAVFTHIGTCTDMLYMYVTVCIDICNMYPYTYVQGADGQAETDVHTYACVYVLAGQC